MKIPKTFLWSLTKLFFIVLYYQDSIITRRLNKCKRLNYDHVGPKCNHVSWLTSATRTLCCIFFLDFMIRTMAASISCFLSSSTFCRVSFLSGSDSPCLAATRGCITDENKCKTQVGFVTFTAVHGAYAQVINYCSIYSERTPILSYIIIMHQK